MPPHFIGKQYEKKYSVVTVQGFIRALLKLRKALRDHNHILKSELHNEKHA